MEGFEIKNNTNIRKLIGKISTEFLDYYLNFMVYGLSIDKLKDEYIKINKNESLNEEELNNFLLVSLSIKRDFNYEFTEYKNIFDNLYEGICKYFYKHIRHIKRKYNHLTIRKIYNEKKLLNKIMDSLNENYLSLQNEFKDKYILYIKILTSYFLNNNKNILFNVLITFK